MAAIRLYLDEDAHPFIADAVRIRGWEALTTFNLLNSLSAEDMRNSLVYLNNWA